jgi:hypothetical protein
LFKSSAPCIGKDLRGVGEVQVHNLSLWKASIKNVAILLDMDNVVDGTFKIPLLTWLLGPSESRYHKVWVTPSLRDSKPYDPESGLPLLPSDYFFSDIKCWLLSFDIVLLSFDIVLLSSDIVV